MVSEQRRTVLAIHMPKTAGTALRWIIERQYPEWRIYKVGADIGADVERLGTLTNEWKRRLRVVFGHFCFGIHRALAPDQLYTYITLLRDPVERIISLYYYAKFACERRSSTGQRVPAHYLNAAAQRMTLAEFATSGVTRTTDNAMVRQLCGADRFTMANGKQMPYDDMALPFGAVTPEHLELARSNIENHFALVGFSELFDETCRRLQEQFAWRIPRVEYKNVGRARRRMKPPPEQERARIEAQNQLDRQLYDWALVRFQEDA